MKTTYQTPVTKVILVAAQRMVCDSHGQPSSSVYDSTVSNINDLQSRQGGSSLWDDEEEE